MQAYCRRGFDAKPTAHALTSTASAYVNGKSNVRDQTYAGEYRTLWRVSTTKTRLTRRHAACYELQGEDWHYSIQARVRATVRII
jgi:hypothetical protein